MVYKDDGSNVPNYLEKVKGNSDSDKLLRQWAQVFNSTMKRTGNESKSLEVASGILRDRLNEDLFKKMTDYNK